MSTDEITFERESSAAVPTAVRFSIVIGKFVETIGRWGTLFMLPLVFITVWDVLQRKIIKGIGDILLAQGWTDARDAMYGTLFKFLPFQSTLLQELEWHFHTACFVLVLGYGYIYNRHVRVDLVREKLEFRKQAWIELFGTTFLMIPYCVIVGYFAFEYASDSFSIGEVSASLVGLENRWAIKSILVVGLVIAGFAGFAIWLQVVVLLFGSKDSDFILFTIERPEEKVEKRIMMESIDDSFGDGSNEAKRGNSTKLMSRNIDEEVFETTVTAGSQRFFYFFGFGIMIIVLILMFHTFNFWSWLI